MHALTALKELGITVYRPRPAAAPVSTQTVPTVQPIRGSTQPPDRPLPVKPATAAGPNEVRWTLALPGGDAWPRLRSHLLAAWQCDEAGVGAADVVFGGRGRMLALPSVGALAGNPALKRQAWQALRALRRAPPGGQR